MQPFSTQTSSSSMKRVAAKLEPSSGRFFSSLRTSLTAPRQLPLIPRCPQFTLAEALGHTSFVLVALSYSIDDVLWLRATAVTGSTAMLAFTYFHPHGKVLWLPFRWNALFIVINTAQILRTLKERYHAEYLDEVDSKVFSSFLRDFDRVDFSKLAALGRRSYLRAGDVLFVQGDMNEYVSLVVEGEFECLVDGQRTYLLKEGNFIAEAGLHVGAEVVGPVRTSGTVRATKPSTILKFERGELVRLLKEEPGLRKSLQSHLSWDIVSKLKLQRRALERGAFADASAWTAKRNVQTDNRYEALVGAMVGGGSISEGDRRVVEKYRNVHVVDDDAHGRALEKVGWSEEEYRRGEKSELQRTRAMKRMDTARAAREDAMLLRGGETQVEGA
mmetsp:Transcript_22820/g.45507  ORF Transcript_22820/g.45507 Transcript_22820/m.45507 type:complete len:388 (+) Transcript_22820:360-1523(+)